MFTKALLVGALAALAAAQSSVISFTNPLPAPARVGTPFELTYQTTDASAPVTILLRKGDANDLQTVSTLTSAASGGSYSWTPASDLEDGDDYALQIQQGTEINYLGPFPIEGGSGTGASPSSSSSSATAPPTYGDRTSYSSITLTATASANGTASTTFTAVAPYGTGNATMPRNTTMSSATLTRTSGPTGTGAGFLGTQTGTAQSTGGAATLMAGSSAIALALGAVAALVMA